MDAEKLAKGCEERAIIFDGADAIFLAQHERECAKVIKNLIDRTESAESRAETLEKMVKEYQDEIVPGYREKAEKAEHERDEALEAICTNCVDFPCQREKCPWWRGEKT